MTFSFIHGLLIGASLIIAIGAQNAFVLRQGLRREHGWWVAGVCAVCDLALIAAGVMGLGRLITASAVGLQLARWGGVAWLLWQALAALRRAARGSASDPLCAQRPAADTTPPAAGGTMSASLVGATPVRIMPPGAVKAILAALGVTLLNPHVYLDTLVMLGVIGGQQSSPLGFVLGASLASLLWFFGLVGLGHWLAPWLAQPRWWRLIDLCVAVVMLMVAWQLAVKPL